MLPVRTYTQKSRPSVAPKYTSRPTATGDDSTLALTLKRQSRRPLKRLYAVTVPSCDVTISRGPAIAGVDGFRPPRRCQISSPLYELSATVFPANVFTYRIPLQ